MLSCCDGFDVGKGNGIFLFLKSVGRELVGRFVGIDEGLLEGLELKGFEVG